MPIRRQRRLSLVECGVVAAICLLAVAIAVAPTVAALGDRAPASAVTAGSNSG